MSKNLYYKNKENAAIASLFLFLSLLTIGYFSMRRLTPQYSRNINRTICIKDLNDSYSGVIYQIDTINGSKKRRVILKDGSIKSPTGLYHHLHKLSPGDSIIKRKGIFAYTVFPKGHPIDSFIVEKYPEFNCDN